MVALLLRSSYPLNVIHFGGAVYNLLVAINRLMLIAASASIRRHHLPLLALAIHLDLMVYSKENGIS
jgi:hypothetical protein